MVLARTRLSQDAMEVGCEESPSLIDLYMHDGCWWAASQASHEPS